MRATEWRPDRLPCGCKDTRARFTYKGEPARPVVVWEADGTCDTKVLCSDGQARDILVCIPHMAMTCVRHGGFA
jgi:hypothetical protein